MAEVSMDDVSSVTVCAVTSGKPIKVLHKVPQLVRFSQSDEALYKSDDKLPFYVLVVAELPIEERNYPLLIFSKGEKRKAFLRELVNRGAKEYLRLAYELYPEDLVEVFSMSKDFPTLEENIQFIIKDLGAGRLLREMRPEEIAQSISDEQEQALLRGLLLRHARPEEIAQAIPDEQKEALLRILLEQLGTEKVEPIIHNDGNRKS
jgi:hypothetical protein